MDKRCKCKISKELYIHSKTLDNRYKEEGDITHSFVLKCNLKYSKKHN